MQRILVAGATGYLGHFVCRELRARGYFVRALVRSPHKLDRLWDVTDEIVHGEVTKPETLNRVCENMDAVFSSVGITRQKDGLSFRDVDYQGNLNLLREARRAGVTRFVYVSACEGPKLRHLDIIDSTRPGLIPHLPTIDATPVAASHSQHVHAPGGRCLSPPLSATDPAQHRR